MTYLLFVARKHAEHRDYLQVSKKYSAYLVVICTKTEGSTEYIAKKKEAINTVD